MPPNLPDVRTAQRLLDVLAQIEHTLRYGRQTAGAATTELETRMANLQFENQRLKGQRQQASQRLGSLLERLQQQLDTESTKPSDDGLAATAAIVREHVA